MSGAVAVFVKTPGVSPVKTRLAVKLGTKTAEAFHLASAQSISSVVRQLSMQTDVVGYYAVAEQSALEHRYWRDLPCLRGVPLLRKLILGIHAQVRGKSLTGLIKICDALFRPAFAIKKPERFFM